MEVTECGENVPGQAEATECGWAELDMEGMECGKVFPGRAETTDCGKAESIMHVSKCGENDCDSAEPYQGYSDAAEFTSLTGKN